MLIQPALENTKGVHIKPGAFKRQAENVKMLDKQYYSLIINLRNAIVGLIKKKEEERGK